MAFGEIRRVGRDFIGDDALTDVFFVRQSQVFFGRDVAEHGGSEPPYHRGADTAGDVVIPRGDVGRQRSQGVEGRLVADLELFVHVLLDQVHGHVAGAFYHHLAVMIPGLERQFTQGFEFGELRLVVRIGESAPGLKPSPRE